MYSCIWLDSIDGIRRSVSVDLCKFFHTCFQGGWFFICHPLIHILPGFLFWLVIIVCLSEEKMSLVGDIRGKASHSDRCCLGIFPDLQTYLLREFEFQPGDKVSRSVDWAGNVCYLRIKLQHKITCIPKCWQNFLCLEKNVWRICCPSEQLLALLLPRECVQTPERPCKLPRSLLCIWTFWLARGKKFEPNATETYVFSFDCIFWSGFSSIMRAYPALLKLASVFKKRCFPGMNFSNSNSQASLRAFLAKMLIGTSVLSNL